MNSLDLTHKCSWKHTWAYLVLFSSHSHGLALIPWSLICRFSGMLWSKRGTAWGVTCPPPPFCYANYMCKLWVFLNCIRKPPNFMCGRTDWDMVKNKTCSRHHNTEDVTFWRIFIVQLQSGWSSLSFIVHYKVTCSENCSSSSKLCFLGIYDSDWGFRRHVGVCMCPWGCPRVRTS